MEIAVIVILGLLLFGGGSRLSNIGKELASGIRNFKRGLNEDSDDEESPKELGEGSRTEKSAATKASTKA